MHEASLVQGLLKVVNASLEEYNASHPNRKAGRIREISCGAGLLACFEPQALKACFQIFSEGTSAQGATLNINTMPLECTCTDCGHKFELLHRHFVCPHCAGENISFKGGNGLVIQAVNVDCEEEDND